MELEKSKGIPQDWDDVKRLLDENRKLKQKLNDVSKVAIRLLEYIELDDMVTELNRPMFERAITTLRRMIE